jgi:flagellar P-ring protein FlgI
MAYFPSKEPAGTRGRRDRSKFQAGPRRPVPACDSKSTLGLLLLLLFSAAAWTKPGTKIREISTVEGVRDNQLMGYGLVVGLNGTGDKRQTVFSAQSMANLLERMGVSVSPTAFQVRNMAAVMITATLPPYAQTGSRIDITVSAIGDASNLQGGILLLTPLKGADGQAYAAAQGPVVTGGFAAGRGGNTQTVNHPTVGRIVAGGLIERLVPTAALDGAEIRLQVKRPDSASAARMASVINEHFQQVLAKAVNPGLVAVTVPPLFAAKRVEFLGEIQELNVEAESRSRIVINERTGTIILGKDVAIAPVSILHGALAVEIQTQFAVSQPNPLGSGQTVTVPDRKVQAKEEKARNVTLKQGATVEDLVRGLQAIGATPRDIIAILDGLRSAGALEADIEVI